MLKVFHSARASLWVPVLFFLLFLILGIAIHKDYGLSWDDPVQLKLGLATWNFISGESDELQTLINRYHNPFIELLEVIPEKLMRTNSERAIYLSKHLFNFIFCWLGMIFLFFLSRRLFNDYRFALLVCTFFILTPRLFAHCFYNSKDLPFLFLCVLSFFCFSKWLASPTWRNIFWIAISSGAATGARVGGIFIPLVIVIAIFLLFIRGKISKAELKMIIGYLLLYPFFIYLFFPTIWLHPFSGITEALQIMSHYPFDVTTFFMGKTVHSLATPWYYFPVWMAITIPIGWWLFFIAGILSFVFRLHVYLKRDNFALWLTVWLWLFLPLLSVIFFGSNLYEDGRHLFFVLPPLLILAVEGFQSLIHLNFRKKIYNKIVKITSWVILLETVISVSIFSVYDHPFQYAYFNAIGRKFAYDYFDKDYWGLSYRNALEFLVRHDSRPEINVNWMVDPGEWNLIWLNSEDRSRLHYVQFDQCEYHITNYRSQHPVDVSAEKIYEIKVQGVVIMAIYKMHPPNKSANF